VLFQKYIPGPPLGEFIEDFWLYDGYSGPHRREQILPSGTFELVVNLRENQIRIYDPVRLDSYRSFTGAIVSGPYAGCFVSDTAEEASILGVHFRPGGAFPFLGLVAGELADTHVELKTLWRARASEFRERLCDAASADERFRLVEHYLIVAMQGRLHRAVPATMSFLRPPHCLSVHEAAQMVGISQRRLIEVFTQQVGLTPKLFSRVCRLQRALGWAATDQDWAQIALESGYFDQSHLIHDFQEFCRMTPADYHRRLQELRRSGVHIKRNHLPLS
jgi:AraC-like DNA-binding protein